MQIMLTKIGLHSFFIRKIGSVCLKFKNQIQNKIYRIINCNTGKMQ